MKSEGTRTELAKLRLKLQWIEKRFDEWTKFHHTMGKLVISGQIRKARKMGIAAEICGILEKQGK